MKTYVISFLLSFGVAFGALAQNGSYHFGVQGAGIAAVTNDTPWQIGAGNYLGVWVDYQIDPLNTLRLGVGYRHLGGYQRVKVTATNRFFPTEHQQDMATTLLENLNHVQLDMSWRRNNSSSPWSYSFGAYFGLLTSVEGGFYRADWQVSQSAFTMNNISRVRLRQGSTYSETRSMQESDFPAIDFGLNAGLHYEITKGLQVEARISQGLQNLLAGSPLSSSQDHYLTALAVGFSAQIK